MLALKLLGIWLLILGCAFFNGALREMVLIRLLGNPGALILSGALLSACILTVSLVFIPYLGVLGVSGYLCVGLLWLVLTLSFEIGFGLVRHQGWSAILEPYRFKDGNLWPLVLAFTFIAPVVAARLRSLI